MVRQGLSSCPLIGGSELSRFDKMRIRRKWFVIWHRYVGLVMAGFLAIAALTGSILVWLEDLEAVVNPQLFRVEPPSQDAEMLSPLSLREIAISKYPGSAIDWLEFKQTPGHSAHFRIEGEMDPVTEEHADLGFNEIFLDPYTGEILGTRKWGDLSQGRVNLMPFIYRLHYALALGDAGMVVMGIIAFIWSFDCFIGAYLTMPNSNRKRPGYFNRWLARWRKRWWTIDTIKPKTKLFPRLFNIHTMSGLWLWAMIFIFAWSSVAFNLYDIYKPITSVFFEFAGDDYSDKGAPMETKAQWMSWEEAVARGEILAKEVAEENGVELFEPASMYFNHHDNMFEYGVFSDRDIGSEWAGFSVIFHPITGEHLTTWMNGEYSGNTMTTWLYVLHLAAIGGMTYDVVVTIFGIGVATLAVTGVWMWWNKRNPTRNL